MYHSCAMRSEQQSMAHQVWWVDIGFETDVTVVVLGVIDRFALLKIRVEPAKLVKRIDVVFFIDSDLSH